MGVVGGSIQIGLNLAGKEDLASKVPTSYLDATVSALIKVKNGDNEYTQTVAGVIDIVEGISTFNFKPSADLQKAGNIISLISISYSVATLTSLPAPSENTLNKGNSSTPATTSNKSLNSASSKTNSTKSSTDINKPIPLSGNVFIDTKVKMIDQDVLKYKEPFTKSKIR